MEQRNKLAIENNDYSSYQTTHGESKSEEERKMVGIMKTNKADLGMYANMWAEEYDYARWYKAREKHLQEKVWELEAKNAELEMTIKRMKDVENGDGCSICPSCEFSYTDGMMEREEVVPCPRCYKCFHGDCSNTACGCVFSDDEADWECEYCEKDGRYDQEGMIEKSIFPNGDWSETVCWCNAVCFGKWVGRMKRKNVPVEEYAHYLTAEE